MTYLKTIQKRYKIGLAVSGGVDSCYLMHKYAKHQHNNHNNNVNYVVLSVNHHLRPESANEVLWVKSIAHNLGLECHILNITNDKPASGIQEFARNQRYKLLAQAAKNHHLDCIYLGHHSDDQAETVLSRLNHQSGYAGLCGMPEMFFYDDICFKRPFLNMSRQEITDSMRSTDYMNDPSNHNVKYERVRNRQFLEKNPELKTKLLHLSHNAKALYYPLLEQRNAFLKEFCVFSPYGFCHINHQNFAKQEMLLQQEILKYTIKYVTGHFYIKAIPELHNKNVTLSGAEICFTKNIIKIYRENRNFIDYDTKRFIKADTGYHKNNPDIPHKAKQTLPSGYFVYKPQSLHYFVTVFDKTQF